MPIAMACGAAAAVIPTSDAAIAAPAIIFFIAQTLQEKELPAREPCLNNPSQPHEFRIITRTDGDAFPERCPALQRASYPPREPPPGLSGRTV
ncbi:hypothetical protein Sliba_34530 [Streptomyces nigrescens]|uniref:Uncharacterized protein n=1 Tax=Streptomyces nigrescens TaxID=1920 RepID=A0A640TIG6_STRNI|nr:hypothetical protein Sliba_34530 [Streptomyces libani subsp. libani]GGV91917.1 hypothetical protein GCM10010500_23230 [Streptomyces libani subsp. libani]